MSSKPEQHRGWYTTRRIPHFDAAHTFQFISFRLSDSLPPTVLSDMKAEADMRSTSEKSTAPRTSMEAFLDRGYGCCLLAEPEMAAQLGQAFNYYDGRRYELIAWCVMPNHVHILIKPMTSLSRIVQGWKTWSARWAYQDAQRLHLQMPPNGFWMRGYWDRYIRDEIHFHAAIAYIHQNPVKAGLCSRAQDWVWSSAKERECGLGPVNP